MDWHRIIWWWYHMSPKHHLDNLPCSYMPKLMEFTIYYKLTTSTILAFCLIFGSAFSFPSNLSCALKIWFLCVLSHCLFPCSSSLACSFPALYLDVVLFQFDSPDNSLKGTFRHVQVYNFDIHMHFLAAHLLLQAKWHNLVLLWIASVIKHMVLRSLA